MPGRSPTGRCSRTIAPGSPICIHAPVSTTSASSISGRITKNGAGVFGAHIAAFNLETGEIVGGFTLNANGDYVIGALPPGPYVVRVEPLDDADPESFFPGITDVNFAVTYSPRLVIAPSGGNAEGVNVEVRPK